MPTTAGHTGDAYAAGRTGEAQYYGSHERTMLMKETSAMAIDLRQEQR
jgi:hypothetical protein